MYFKDLKPMEKELFDAVNQNDLGKVKAILENGTVPATIIRTTNGLSKWTLAHNAIGKGHLEMLKFLVKKEPTLLTRKIEKEDHKYQSPLLETAIECDHFDIVKYLVEECNADIFEERQRYSDYLLNPICRAARGGNVEILKYLIKKGNVNVNAPFKLRKNLKDVKYPPSLLFLAFIAPYERRDAMLEYLINETDIDVTAVDRYGRNILYQWSISSKIIQCVLDKYEDKFDINKKYYGGQTMLYAHASDIHAVQYLVEKKRANVNIPTDDWKWTPLHCVTASNQRPVCEYLINHGANIEAEDKDGDTPLHLAAMGAYLDVCKLLIKRGADVNRKNHRGDSPLHYAIMGHYKKFNGSTKISWGSKYDPQKAPRVFTYLIDHGANLTQKNREGTTPIDGIISKGRLKYLEYLIRRGIVGVNWRNERQETLVHLAVISNQIPILDYLVRRKHADVNTRRNGEYNKGRCVRWDRWTPLHSALALQHYEACVYLIKHGADVKLIDWRDDEDMFKKLKSVQYEVHSGRARRSVVQSSKSKINLETSSLEKFSNRRLTGFESSNHLIPIARDPIFNGTTYQFGGFLTFIHYLFSYFGGLVYKPEPTFADGRAADLVIEDATKTLPDFP